MATIRAQVSLPRINNVPEDTVINTFHFITPGPVVTDAEYADISTRLADFYLLPGGVLNRSIGNYIGDHISRVPLGCKIKLYNLADLKPRPIRYEGAFTMADPESAILDLPGEVALCLSYRAAAPPGVPIARTRGRVYVGPFHANAVTMNNAGDTRPASALITSMRDRGFQLTLAGEVIGAAKWAVYSTIDNVARAVISGWVDDAFDTQRRRGSKATTRLLFDP